MSNQEMNQDEPMLLYCTDEDGEEVCFELLGQLTYEEDGNDYALLGLKDEQTDTLAPVSSMIVRLSEDGEDTVMDPVDDEELENILFGIFEEALNSTYDFDEIEE